MLTAYAIVMVALLFGVTVFVHELGHFLTARWCGMVVEVFSIGFGPAIWKRKVGGVTYKIGCIPFGGYVALPQMEPGGGERVDDEGQPLPAPPRIAPWKKILVALAGAAGNLALAVILAYVVYGVGKSFAPPDDACTIGYVQPESAAYAAGLRMGDRVLDVNGASIRHWDDLAFAVGTAEAGPIVARVESPDGQTRMLDLPADELLGTRMLMGVGPANYCYVLRVEPGSSAEAAGLRAMDRIVSIDGVNLYSREHLIEIVSVRADEPLKTLIDRKGERFEVVLTPTYNEAAGRALIGVMFNTFDVKPPWAQIKGHAELIFKVLRALVSPKQAGQVAQNVGGPVAIFHAFWLYVQTGLVGALWFTGLLNVNLAVLNLLPLPVLDGGHVVFALWEAVTRKPVSARVVNVLVNVFAVLLIALFLFLTYRDVDRVADFSRLLNGETNAAPAEVEP